MYFFLSLEKETLQKTNKNNQLRKFGFQILTIGELLLLEEETWVRRVGRDRRDHFMESHDWRISCFWLPMVQVLTTLGFLCSLVLSAGDQGQA